MITLQVDPIEEKCLPFYQRIQTKWLLLGMDIYLREFFDNLCHILSATAESGYWQGTVITLYASSSGMSISTRVPSGVPSEVVRS
jgi:hypothetical protein